MKDTVSIIFAAIFMVFVIVILPLFSILDRQDNISYNVVLTQTTKFVDEIRANGFVTDEAYQTFMSSLASTGNTYKVTLEAYKHSLIQETRPDGTIVNDSYIDELELYNTQDIIDHLSGNKVNIEANDSNRKQNIYLFEKSDEIYVRVYNTNVTAGSIMYNMLMGAVDTKVIDITYGGAVNNVNWELYTKMKVETIEQPEITLSVPVNAKNDINVKKIVTDEQLKDVECIVEDYGGLFADPHEMCTDIGVDDIYKYIYDLDETDEDTGEEINKKITIAARFSDVTQIQVRPTNVLEYVYGDTLDEILDILDLSSYENWSYIVNNNVLDSANWTYKNMEKYIIDNYIRLNGMTADIDLTRYKSDGSAIESEHAFYIVLTNVKMATTGALSENASVAILQGLGRNDYHDLSVGDETVIIELSNKTDVRTTAILGPYNWKQYLRTKLADASLIDPDRRIVYRNQEIFFKIQYTGIKDLNPDEVKERIKTRLSFNRDTSINYGENSGLTVEYYTPLQMSNLFDVAVEMDTIVVKYSYTDTHELTGNRYLNLGIDWYPGMDQVQSEYFLLDEDTAEPKDPAVDFQGTEGDNGWFVSDVTVKVAADEDNKQTSTVSGRTGYIYSGVYKSTVSLTGPQTLTDKDSDEGVQITANTTSSNPVKVVVKTLDYVGNVNTSSTYNVYVDKVPPSTPVVTVAETPTETGWYNSDVHITVDTTASVRKDTHSGISRTTYQIEGANAQTETTYSSGIVLDESGVSRVTIKNYDVAGNYSTYSEEFKIDKGEPAFVEFENIEGLKNNETTEWYHTDVKTRIKVLYTGSLSQVKPSHYEVLDKDGNEVIAKTSFSEEIKDITLSNNNIYTINVYTTTTAGTTRTSTWVVKIDENAPNLPTMDFDGTKGEFKDSEGNVESETEWYTSDVEITVTLEDDIGDSGVTEFTYITKLNEEEEVKVENNSSGTKINITEEGQTLLTVITEDAAGNPIVYEETIKIDKSKPTPATIVIDAQKEEWSDWYHSQLYISHVDSADDVSDISKVEIEQYEGSDEDGWTLVSSGVWDVVNTTKSRKIVLTTYNGAALYEKTEQIIKMDNIPPTAPTISTSVTDGTKYYEEGGTYMAGGQVTISITDGEEVEDSGKESGYKETYYRYKESTAGKFSDEVIGTSLTLDVSDGEDKYYIVVAGSRDNAGNETEESKVIRICKAAPPAPSIVAINGQSVDSSVIEDSSSTATLEIISANGIKIDVYVAGTLVNTVTNDGTTYINSIDVGTTFADGVETEIYIKQTSLFGIESAASNTVRYKYVSGGG